MTSESRPGLPETSPKALVEILPPAVRRPAQVALRHIQHGTFQRSMSLLVAASSAVSAMEVGYEHYRGSYSNPVMYSPVLLSVGLTASSIAAFFSRRAARTWMRYLGAITLVDGLVGFCFHIRGVARKPGGWRMPVVNIVMGPPLFAPLLFGTSAYLGVIASYLQREEDEGPRAMAIEATVDAESRVRTVNWRKDIETGAFQKHLCVVCAIGTLCCGGESWYSHYKDNFQFRVQWSPLIVTPLLAGAAIASVFSERCARTALPAASATAMLNGVIGTYYHVRGIGRKAGGFKKPLYNTLYGPPIFAPMLFAAAGLLGMMAYLMRRERNA